MTTTTSPDEALDAEIVDEQEQTPTTTPQSTELAVRQPPAEVGRRDLRSAVTDSWSSVVADVAWLANMISASDFVPEIYRGKPGQIAATVLHGRELGLGPMSALAMTNPIHGKPAISAEAMRALVLQAGHSIRFVETSGTRCVMEGRRAGDEDWTRVEWTMADVTRAGIRNGNYAKYPRQMLQARASVELCRMIFSDVIHGLRATEELLDEIEAGSPAPTSPAAQGATSPVSRAPKRPRKSSQGESDTQPTDTAEAPNGATVPEQPAPPARKRAARPAPRGTSSHPQESGDSDGAASVEEQRAEIRSLSQERRDLKGGTGARGEGLSSAPAGVGAEGAPDPDEAAPAADQGEPAEPVITNSGRDTGPALTAAQRVQILRHFDRLELADRDERLRWTNKLAGLAEGTLTSTNELRFTEARQVINHLERFRNRDQLDAAVNGQDELLGGAE